MTYPIDYIWVLKSGVVGSYKGNRRLQPFDLSEVQYQQAGYISFILGGRSYYVRVMDIFCEEQGTNKLTTNEKTVTNLSGKLNGFTICK